jgi:tetratricopeptide (TPR) repeat protein
MSGRTAVYPEKFDIRDLVELNQPSPKVAVDPTSERLHDELLRLEAWGAHLVVDGKAPFMAALDDARRVGDEALLGRALCLAARAELFWGQLDASAAAAKEAIAAFERLTERERLRLAGPHSEAWRVLGNGRLRIGEVAAAMPLFEHAIRVAERGVDAAVSDEASASAIPATSGLLTALNGLGVALISMREMAGAEEVLSRALDLVDSHPQTQHDVPDDIVYILGNLVKLLQQEARDRLAAGENADVQLAQARELLETRAAGLIARRGEPGSKVSVLALRDFLEMSSRHLLLEGRLDEALARFQNLADSRGVDRWRGAIGERGLAETLLALGRPADACSACIGRSARIARRSSAWRSTTGSVGGWTRWRRANMPPIWRPASAWNGRGPMPRRSGGSPAN